ncbi:hypothetical protein DOL88_06250 [Aggregatibacter aphrophilus]|uniref:Uncharacterized protein n=1 Tax=Aggregatibacter aphrophilus TaxID=732 RepID=A0ABX9VVD6_AGGAP|nr:hypothetical protein DOL88_06250 [Aggregatibacter aphrophilus]
MKRALSCGNTRQEMCAINALLIIFNSRKKHLKNPPHFPFSHAPLLAQTSFACAFACALISTNIYFQHKRGRLRYHIKILTDSARLLTRACPLNLYKARVSGDARYQCTLDNI